MQFSKVTIEVMDVLLLLPILLMGLWSCQPLIENNPADEQSDTFVDPNNPATNYDGQRLEVAYSNFPEIKPTRFSLLKFDLAKVEKAGDSSGLTLTIVENNLPVG